MFPYLFQKNSFSFYIHFIFICSLLLPLIHSTNLNCKTSNVSGECTSCNEGFILSKSKQCIPCKDPNCKQCLPNLLCINCFDSFILKNNKCGKICNAKVKNCDLCNKDNSKCISCKKGCSYDEKTGFCSCTTKTVIILLSFGISFIVVSIIVYCLTNTTIGSNYAIVEGIPIKLEEEKDNHNGSFTSRSNKRLNSARSKKSTNVSIELENIQKLPDIQSKLGSEANILGDDMNINTETPSIGNKRMLPHSIETNNSISTNNENVCDYCLVEPIVIQKKCGCSFCIKHKELKEMNSNGQEVCIICRTQM